MSHLCFPLCSNPLTITSGFVKNAKGMWKNNPTCPHFLKEGACQETSSALDGRRWHFWPREIWIWPSTLGFYISKYIQGYENLQMGRSKFGVYMGVIVGYVGFNHQNWNSILICLKQIVVIPISHHNGISMHTTIISIRLSENRERP